MTVLLSGRLLVEVKKAGQESSADYKSGVQLSAGISTAIGLGVASMVASIGYVLLPMSKKLQTQLEHKRSAI